MPDVFDIDLQWGTGKKHPARADSIDDWCRWTVGATHGATRATRPEARHDARAWWSSLTMSRRPRQT